jgi:hypothetical protein
MNSWIDRVPTGPAAVASSGDSFMSDMTAIADRQRKESAFVALLNLDIERSESDFTKKLGEAGKSASS